MGKRGRAYEEVVTQVLKALDRGASVNQGVWVEGPDGRRELDVLISGVVDGRERTVIVECKDFDPKATGPVGIAYVDALDSKRRDLKASLGLICSNTGFTSGAISKARRVGIGLIAIMRKGDKRIRFAVVEELFTRKVQVKKLSIGLRNPDVVQLDGVPFEGVKYEGVPIGNWVVRRVMLLIGSNPIVNGSFKVTHELRHPTRISLPEGEVLATGIDLHVSVSGGWFVQQIEIDATAAVYDWIRRRVRMASGPGQLLLKGVNVHEGTLVERPPDSELKLHEDIRDGEMTLALLLLEGLPSGEPIPDIDALVVPKDLELKMDNIPEELVTSRKD